MTWTTILFLPRYNRWYMQVPPMKASTYKYCTKTCLISHDVKLQNLLCTLYFIMCMHSAAQLVSLHDYLYCRVFIDWPDSNWCCQTVCRQRICKHTAHSQWYGLLQQNHYRVRGSLHLWWGVSPGWYSNKSVPEWWCMEWKYTSVLTRSRRAQW